MDYSSFINELLSKQDMQYRNFHKSLLRETHYEVVGIRTPILRSIAKQYKDNYEEIINHTPHYYEEVMIRGFIISQYFDYYKMKEEMKKHLELCDNWASIDLIIPKIIKKNKRDYFEEIKSYLQNSNPWFKRYGLVCLLSHYVEETYIDEILMLVNEVDNTNYYVMMANAWLISTCAIKFYERTLEFLKQTTIDKTMINKAISKCHDSFRLTKLQKEELAKLRR